MITRDEVLGEAVNKCLQELYSNVQPKVTWTDFIQENRERVEGTPPPCEFYYIPKKLMEEIVSDYVYAYDLEPKVRNTIDALIDYLREPITIAFQDNTKKYVKGDSIINFIGEDAFNMVVQYLTDAGDFYRWDADLQKFHYNIYLGASPSTSKEQVINNWKKYRNKDITIDDSKYLEYVQDGNLRK